MKADGTESILTTDLDGKPIGPVVETLSYLDTFAGAINDTTALINAIKSGKPLPTLVSGLKLANDITRLNGQNIPNLSNAATIGSAALSIYSLSQALKSGDGLAVISSAAQTLAAVGEAAKALNGSSALADFFAKGGSGANVLPALSLIVSIKNGDPVGVVGSIASMAGVPGVGWAIAVYQLAKSLKSPPEAWGHAEFKFDSQGRLALTVEGESLGTSRVQGLMEGNGKPPTDPDYNGGLKGYLEGLIAQAQAAHPQEPLGIIAQRMPGLYWREARQGDPGYAVVDVDPLTGQPKLPNLRYDDDLKPFNATGSSQEERYTLLERLVTSAIARDAIAPMWEVRTAQMQQQAGDPLAGLTEVMRAGRRNYLAPLDAAGKPISGGKFRPVALDLNGDGQVTVTARAGSSRLFNWDDSGFDKSVGWVGSTEGLLFLDRNPNGQVDGGAELFSNSRVIDAAKGLRALDAVDANGDNLINSSDPVFEELRIWQDLNGDGRSSSNELKKLAELGITELDYKSSRFTRNGQIYSMESPDLEASDEGYRSSVTPEGIKVQLSDGTVKIYASRVDDKSLYAGVASIDAAEAVEGSPLDFAVRLSTPSAGITTVQVGLSAGSATAGEDFATQMQVSFDGGRSFEPVVNGIVRVPAHVPLFTLRVPTVQDTYSEGQETLTLQATTTANLVPAVAVGTIRNVDVARPAVSVNAPVSVSETDGFATIEFTLSSAAPNSVTMNWQTADAGATAGSDYAGVSGGQIIFAAGETRKTVRIPIFNDNEVESPEAFKVLITSAIGADLGVSQRSISIISEDTPPVVLKVGSIYASADANEGDPVTFNVGLNIPVGAAAGAAVPLRLRTGAEGGNQGLWASAPVKVSFNGGSTWTAMSTDGYGDLNLVVPQGVQNFQVVVQTEYDTVRNQNRTASLSAADQSISGTAVIRDRGTSDVYFASDVASAAEAAGGRVFYTLKLDYARSTPVTVGVAADPSSTALAGQDFIIRTPSVTFAPGQTTQQVEVEILKDALVEGDESFKLLLQSPTGATLPAGGSSTAGTLISDSPVPDAALSIASVSARSAPEGSYVGFTVNLSTAVAADAGATVDLELLNGSAVAGQDFVNDILVSINGGAFTSVGSSVWVPKGASSFEVRVVAQSDLANEPDENFSLRAKVGSSSWRSGLATIYNVAPPQLNIQADAASVSEGQRTIGYTVTLSAASAGPVSVSYSAQGLTATAGSDFSLLPQTDGSFNLAFAPGETSKRFEVQVLDDSTYEGNETFNVQLGAVAGLAVLGNAASVTTRIDENDAAPPPAFSVVNDALSSAREDDPISFSLADLLRNDSFGGVAGNDAASGLNITAFSAGTGVQSIQRNGDNFELRFVPNFNGTAEFSYTVQARDGRTAAGRATLEVSPVADAPVVRFVADQKPIYGYGPSVVRTSYRGDETVTITMGAGLAQYEPYQTVASPLRLSYRDSEYWGTEFVEYDIPYSYFLQELASQRYSDGEYPEYIVVNTSDGRTVKLASFSQPVSKNAIIGWETSNDGHIEVADIDDPSGQSTYVITSMSSDETYGGRVDSFSGNGFQFTGRRYVDRGPDGRYKGNNYFTDEHGRYESSRTTLVHGTLRNSSGKEIPFSFDVPVFGPAPEPNIHNGSKKPIAIDLNGDGFHFTDIDDSNVFFDVNGDGWRRKIAWNNPQDGFIVLDKNSDGKITDFDELSFVPHKPDGQSDLEGLKAFDTNKDGVFSAADKDWGKFGVWRDANSNGVTDAGELLTLDSLGIQRIELSTDGKLQVINGQSVTGQGRAVKGDGGAYALADVTLKYRDVTVVTPPNGGPSYVTAIPKYQPGQKFEGTSGKDLILGAAGSDEFIAGDGNDVIHDDGGNDHVRAGAGDDVIFTGMDNDVIEAGLGNDQVFAGVGDDLVFGEEGDDLLMLEGGNDIAFGGAGQDSMSGGNGNDALSGDDGDDKLFGEAGWDALLGQDGDDELRGMEGNDYLDGGAGNDLLLGGAGDDKMDGGAGDDTYEVDSAGDQVVEAANAGIDTVLASISYDLARAENVENITLTGTADLGATGNAGSNKLVGNTGKNLLQGGAGNDVLDGGAGADTMVGGQGDDTYYVDNAQDVATELAGEGLDLVISRIDYVAADHLENVTLAGIAATAATGNALANVLTGNDQDNVLDGKAGADSMIGSRGNDRYVVDNAGDQVIEAAGEGYDTIVSSLQATVLSANVEALELTGSATQGVGNALDNYIVGTAGDNLLQGLEGNDTLSGGQGSDRLEGGTGDDRLDGGEGNDHLDGGDGNDLLVGGAGGDIMRGGSGDDQYFVESSGDQVQETAGGGVDSVNVTGLDSYTLTDEVENLTLGAGARKGRGNALANVIRASTGTNVIEGLAGDDTITDAGGSDVIDGGDGDDVITDIGAGTNELRGGAGKDSITVDATATNSIFGDAGDDSILVSVAAGSNASLGINVIDGGAGNDSIRTAAGADTVRFGFGDGSDVWTDDATAGAVNGIAGADTLAFKNGVTLENLLVERVGSDLKIRLVTGAANGTDHLLIKDWFTSNAHRMERVMFSDGSSITPEFLERLRHALRGTDGNDVLTGTSQDDVIFGLGGNDTISGLEGNDLLFGGGGDDTFLLQYGTTNSDLDQFDGGSGVNTVQGVDGAVVLNVLSGLSNLKNIQVLDGGTGNVLGKVIQGTTGNDVLDFSTLTVKNFTVNAGAGNDVVTGTSSNDILAGGEGSDSLIGGDGDDTFLLQYGPVNSDLDQFDGGSGVNTVQGVDGAVVLNVLSGLSNLKNIQVLDGGTGNVLGKVIQGTTGNDVLDFSTLTVKNFTVNAGAGNDVVTGTSSNDILAGGEGSDTLIGGDGDDTFLLQYGPVNSDLDQFDGGSGVNTVQGVDGAVVLNVLSGLSNLKNIQVLDGGTGNVLGKVIQGTAGNDVLDFSKLTVKNFTVNAGAGNDVVTGTSSNDILAGGEGSDTLIGGDGDDTFLLQYGPVNSDLDQFDGGSGVNTVQGVDGAVVLNVLSGLSNLKNIQVLDGGTGNVLGKVIQGTAGNDVLDFSKLTVRNFTINAGTGNDSVWGTSGNDIIMGGEGNDTIVGGEGDDVLNGGAGDDTFVLPYGQLNSGLDQYDGGSGVNTIQGGDGYTTLNVVSGLSNLKNIQVLDGGTGSIHGKQILATAGNDVLDFSGLTVKNFTINAGAGNDTVTGTSGNDTIVGGEGDDVLNGGAGDDTFVLPYGQLNSGLDQYDGGSGVNTIQGVDGYTTLNVVSGLSNLKNIQVLDGGTGSIHGKQILATAGNDVLDFSGLTVKNFTINAGTGNDTVVGTSGNDTIVGGEGDDVLNGGAGDDTFVLPYGELNSGLDQYDGGSGVNTIQGGGGYTTLNVVSGLSNLKNIQVLDGGTGSIHGKQILATAGNDVLDFSGLTVKNFTINAGAGNDTVAGTSGNDTIVGGEGDDVLNGGAGDDTFVLPYGELNSGLDQYDGGSGVNTIQGGGGYTTLNVVSGLNNLKNIQVLDGGTGNVLGKVIQGTTGNDVLDFSTLTVKNFTVNAGAGNDVVTGTSSNDILAGGEGSDTLSGGDGDDTFLLQYGPVNSDLDQFDGGSGVNTVQGVDGAVVLNVLSGLSNLKNIQVLDGGTGNVMGKVIQGTAGNDVLDFSKLTVKNFTVNAGAGNDVVTGTSGNDIIFGGQGNDQLMGGVGNDTYLYERGDGVDTITDFTGVNQIEFGYGIRLDDVKLALTSTSLSISLLSNGVTNEVIKVMRAQDGQLGVTSVRVDGNVYDVSLSNGATLTLRQSSSPQSAQNFLAPPSQVKAAFVRGAEADGGSAVLDRWSVMQASLVAMPSGYGSSVPELIRTDSNEAVNVVLATASTGMRRENGRIGIA